MSDSERLVVSRKPDDWTIIYDEESGAWKCTQFGVNAQDGHKWDRIFERNLLGEPPSPRDEVIKWLPHEVPAGVKNRLADDLLRVLLAQ